MIRQNKSSNVFSINTLENSNFDCDYDIQHTQNNIINSSSGNNKISNSEEVKCCGNKDHNEGRRIIFNNNKSNSQMRKILRKKEEGNIYDNLIHKQQRLVKKHDDNCDINAILLIIKSLLSISIFNLSSFYCHLISSYSRKNSDKKNIVFSRLVIIVKFLRKNNKYQSLIKVLLTAFIVLHLNESFCNLVVSAAANVTIDKTRATIIVKNFSSNNNVYNNINNNNNINEPPLDSINLNLVNEFEEFNNDEGYSHYTHTWAVHIPNGDEDGIADAVAREHGFINRGKIFDDHYHFEHKSIQKRSIDPAHHHQKRLHEDERVQWAQQQRAKSRQKRDFIRMKSPRTLQLTPLSFYWNDPKWPQMWYLNRGNSLDMNVIPAWKEGITGKGIVVTILDDGLESDHPDLEHNYDPKASYDVNSHDEDPMPHYDMTDSNRHGTRCAGEVAATANNSLCAVGIAFGARVGGVRMLDGDVTDAVEARSLSLNPQHIDIYSASWGPDDDGKTVDGPGDLASRAFIEGVTKGRNGKGSIFIWASGNGGREQDNCNCDGYTNSIWTLSISSATEEGHVPWYSEKCSSTLATTYSSGGQQEKQVVTTDLHHSCTISHTGTSASAPLAAGIAALVLEANRNLTWRDLQHIVVRTGKPGNLKDPTWARNGVGRLVSHSFGYGLMDAAAMVKLARTWKTVPEQQKCEINAPHIDKPIPSKGYISLQLTVKHCMGVNFLEHVQAKITLTSQRRGDIQIYLTSPAGTKVTLLTTRAHDVSRSGFNHWPFMSVHTWGETPRGNWQLEIRNEGKFMGHAMLREWSLIFYGTAAPIDPNDPISTRQPPLKVANSTVPNYQQRQSPTSYARFPSSPSSYSVVTYNKTNLSPQTNSTLASNINNISSSTKKNQQQQHHQIIQYGVNFSPRKNGKNTKNNSSGNNKGGNKNSGSMSNLKPNANRQGTQQQSSYLYGPNINSKNNFYKISGGPNKSSGKQFSGSNEFSRLTENTQRPKLNQQGNYNGNFGETLNKPLRGGHERIPIKAIKQVKENSNIFSTITSLSPKLSSPTSLSSSLTLLRNQEQSFPSSSLNHRYDSSSSSSSDSGGASNDRVKFQNQRIPKIFQQYEKIQQIFPELYPYTGSKDSAPLLSSSSSSSPSSSFSSNFENTRKQFQFHESSDSIFNSRNMKIGSSNSFNKDRVGSNLPPVSMNSGGNINAGKPSRENSKKLFQNYRNEKQKQGIYLPNRKNTNAQITQWDLIFYGTETPPQPDDPIQITPGRFGGYGGEIEHNDLNFDSEISGQWRNSHQVSESHADVQRTANDQTNAACVKFSPDNTCIDCDRTTFLFNGRCYLKCPSGTYMIPERIDLNNDNDNDSGRTIKSFSLNIGYGGGDAGKIGNDIRYKSGRLREKLKQCDNCDTRCFECFGPSQSECVSCHPGYKLRKVSSKEFYCYSFKERSFRNGNGYLYDGPKATEDNINNDNFGISGNAFLFGIIILPSIALCSLVVIVTLYKKSYSNHPSPNSKYGKNYIYDLVEFDVPNEEAHILLCENDNDKSESSPGDLYERTEWNLEDDEEKGDSFAIKNSENTGFDSGNFERTLNDNSTVEDS